MITNMVSSRVEIHSTNRRRLDRLPLSAKLLLCLVAFTVLGGTNDTILAKYQLVVIGMYIIYCVVFFRRQDYPLTSIIRNTTEHSIILLIVFVASALYSIDTAMTLRMCLYLLIYEIVWEFYLDIRHYVTLINTIRIVGVILAVSIIVSALTKERFVTLISPWLMNKARVLQDIRYGQFSGLVGDRSFAAIAMCNSMYAEFSVMLCNRKINKWNILALLLCLIAMFLTGKRITILMLLCGVISALVVSRDIQIKRTSIIAIVTMLALSIGAMYILPQTQVVLNRVLNGIGDASLNDRTKFWSVALEMFLRKPMTGWGIGSFLQFNLENGTGIRQYAHNMYLQFAAEIGVIGTALVMWLLLRFLNLTAMLTKKSVANNDSHNKRLICLFSLMSQIGFFAYGITGYPFYNIQQGFLYAICASMILCVDTSRIREVQS